MSLVSVSPPRPGRRRFLLSSALATAGVCAGAGARLLGATPTPPVRVAVIGLGGRGRVLLSECLAEGATVVALCDADTRALAEAAKQAGAARHYEDYRVLLREAEDIEAVIIATPDHWHAHLCRSAMLAGKHVYCEKPLTRTIGEARELRAIARRSRVATQLGNQGSAYASLRRSVELVRAGLLGNVDEVHTWIEAQGNPEPPDPEGADPVPAGLNWDLWLGPAPVRPYKDRIYHPGSWRRWYDFGSGRFGDFACHGFNLPVRALGLGFPDRVEITPSRSSPHRYHPGTQVRLHFAARGRRAPVTLFWHDGYESVPDSVTEQVRAVYPKLPFSGCFLRGEAGMIHATIWGEKAVIRMKNEDRPRGVMEHDGARGVPVSLPRTAGHMREWLDACRGQGRTFSDFAEGGRLTEIALAGTVALRLGRDIRWEGDRMRVPDEPAAERFVRAESRSRWL